MSLPRFIDRAADASLPVLAALGRTEFRDRLASLCVRIGIDENQAEDGPSQAAYLLAVNLAARLYPRLIVAAPGPLRAAAMQLATEINPSVELPSRGLPDGRWVWSRRASRGLDVHAYASGWGIGLDGARLGSRGAEVPAALAAAAIGIGDLFRTIFTSELGTRGRRGPEPRSFSLLGPLDAWGEAPPLAARPQLGRAYLVGAGAVGEAAALTFRETGAAGTLVAVDPERLDVGNLQRYPLAIDRHEGMSKVSILAERLAETAVSVEQVATVWGADERTQGPVETVLSATDSAQSRVEVQTTLPRRLFNAYTQPLDVGWSRHEDFGSAGCLACLYWPMGPRPHRHEVLGDALGQDPQRVLRYLILPGLTIDKPIPAAALPPTIDAVSRDHWASVPISQDIGDALFGARDALEGRGRETIADLYHEMCAGMVVPTVSGGRDRDVQVPLAQQSALAGIMLATQVLIANDPDLARLRGPLQQTRYDILRPDPPRHLMVGRVSSCICNDEDYLTAYRARWASVGVGH